MCQELVVLAQIKPQIVLILFDSQLVPKIIETCGYGDNQLLTRSLDVFKDYIETIQTNEEVFTDKRFEENMVRNVLNIQMSAVIKTLTKRVVHLKWRTSRVSTEDLKTDYHKLFNKKMSEGVRGLCQTLSSFTLHLSLNFCDNPNDSHRLFLDMKPLMSKLMTCGDSQTTVNIVFALNAIISCDLSLFTEVIIGFGQIMLDLIQSRDDVIVLSVLQVLNQLLSDLDFPHYVWTQSH